MGEAPTIRQRRGENAERVRLDGLLAGGGSVDGLVLLLGLLGRCEGVR